MVFGAQVILKKGVAEAFAPRRVVMTARHIFFCQEGCDEILDDILLHEVESVFQVRPLHQIMSNDKKGNFTSSAASGRSISAILTQSQSMMGSFTSIDARKPELVDLDNPAHGHSVPAGEHAVQENKSKRLVQAFAAPNKPGFEKLKPALWKIDNVFAEYEGEMGGLAYGDFWKASQRMHSIATDSFPGAPLSDSWLRDMFCRYSDSGSTSVTPRSGWMRMRSQSSLEEAQVFQRRYFHLDTTGKLL